MHTLVARLRLLGRSFASFESFVVGACVVGAGAIGCANQVPNETTTLGHDGGDAASTSDGTSVDTAGAESAPTETGIGPITYLTLSPANPVIEIDLAATPVVPATQAYSATVSSSDGTSSDATASTTFTVDDTTLGSFVGNVFTSVTSLPTGVLGKSTVVHGAPGSGVANITVVALNVTGDEKDFFFIEPYEAAPTPANNVLKFSTKLQQVDVAFLMDTTASMGPEISVLNTALASDTGIIASLTAAIPSVAVAVAHHEDFPVAPFGYPGDGSTSPNTPFELLQAVTTNLSAARSAVLGLQPYYGGLLPEIQYEAQYELLTGDGFVSNVDPTHASIAAHTPAAGTRGGANFRAGSLPVVVQITDASWWTPDQYDGATPIATAIPAGNDITGVRGRDDVVAAYGTLKAKFVGVAAVIPADPTKGGATLDTPCDDYHTPSCDSAKGYGEHVDMALATGSYVDPSVFTPSATCAAGQCCTGFNGAGIAPDTTTGQCPLVFQARGCCAPGTNGCSPTLDPTCGTGVDNGIVAAIQAISVGSAFDVTAVASNDPSNALGPAGSPVDATKFIQSLRAMDEGSVSDGCPAHAAIDTDGDGIKDTFTSVIVGTPVCFEVNAAENTTVPATTAPQFFKAFIDVVGMPGSVELDRRSVLFLVPPEAQNATH